MNFDIDCTESYQEIKKKKKIYKQNLKMKGNHNFFLNLNYITEFLAHLNFNLLQLSNISICKKILSYTYDCYNFYWSTYKHIETCIYCIFDTVFFLYNMCFLLWVDYLFLFSFLPFNSLPVPPEHSSGKYLWLFKCYLDSSNIRFFYVKAELNLPFFRIGIKIYNSLFSYYS